MLDPQPIAEPTPDDEPGEVLAWWRSKLNLAVLGVTVALVAGALGWMIGHNRATPDPNAADIGFLQDMRWHHDQAVQLSLIYLALPDTTPALRTLAREIIVGQSQESGYMVGLLRQWRRAEINETDVAMGWMGHEMPLDEMDGLASEAEIEAFTRTSGRAASETFVQLMSAHHEGGAHMADAAAQRAATAEVRTMARQMADNQREEILEMAQILKG